MQFLSSIAFRKHMIVSSVAILAIFSTYPSYAESLFADRAPIARIYSASRDVRSECMHLTEKCSERAGNDREAVHRCYHELQMCLQRNGRSLAAR